MEILQFIGSIGEIAGVLASVIFCIYRQDRKSSADQLREYIELM